MPETTNSIVKEKSILRIQIKEQRSRLSRRDVVHASRKISDKLELLAEIEVASKVHIYIPIKDTNEIDTWGFIAWLKQEYPDTLIDTTILDDGDNHHTVDVKSITLGVDYGDLSAEKSVVADVDNTTEYDLIIVPCLATDKLKNRLGYGGGFYDKFLSAQPGAVKIGLCYELFNYDELPVEAHDISMDVVLT